MLEIKGDFTDNLPFVLRKEGDLLFYNGPILSHFKSNKEEDYFMFWVDNDDTYTRWLLFQISFIELANYFSKNKSLKEILLDNKNDVVYVVDLDSSLNYKKNYLTQVYDLKEEYLPGDKSFYNEKYATPYSKGLSS